MLHYLYFSSHGYYTVFRKKHTLTFSFIFPWKIFRFLPNFHGMFRRNQVFLKSSIFFAIGDVMLRSYFRVCKLWVLPLKTDIWRMLKTHQLIIVLTEHQNMLICHTIFHCKMFLWLFFWLSARSSTLLMLAGVCALRHCVDDHLPANSQMAWYCLLSQFFY